MWTCASVVWFVFTAHSVGTSFVLEVKLIIISGFTNRNMDIEVYPCCSYFWSNCGFDIRDTGNKKNWYV